MFLSCFSWSKTGSKPNNTWLRQGHLQVNDDVIDKCDAKIYLFIPERDFIFARVKTGQVGT